MRPLTARQAASCETATSSRCACRCGGVSHGAGRMLEAEREFFEALPQDDPHWIPKARQPRLPKDWLPQPITKRIDGLVQELNQLPGVTASSSVDIVWEVH